MKKNILLSLSLFVFLLWGNQCLAVTVTDNVTFGYPNCKRPMNISSTQNGTLEVSISQSASINLLYRSLRYEFHKKNGSSYTLEGTVTKQISPPGTNTPRSYRLFVSDFPSSLSSGVYEIRLVVEYRYNGSNTLDRIITQANGAQKCGSRSFIQNGTLSGSYRLLECPVGVISCINYQSCHTASIYHNTYRNRLEPRVSGGSGNYTYTWRYDAVYSLKNGTFVSKYLSLGCGTYRYILTVKDINTQCVVNSAPYTYNRWCTSNPSLPVGVIDGPIVVNCCRLGEASESEFELYPNPATSYTILKYELHEVAQANVELFNATGQRIYTSLISEGSQQLKIEVKNYATGLYFARISAKGILLYEEKLLIQHRP